MFKHSISNFLFGKCSFKLKEIIWQFLKKYKFLIFLWFFEKWKLWRTRARSYLPIFLENWTLKNKPDRQQWVQFRKSHKVLNHSTQYNLGNFYSILSCTYKLYVRSSRCLRITGSTSRWPGSCRSRCCSSWPSNSLMSPSPSCWSEQGRGPTPTRTILAR